jgi:cytochrome P450
MYAINADSTKRPHFTFGAGRRVCPGFHVAERGLFIAIARMLWDLSFIGHAVRMVSWSISIEMP